MVHPKFRFVRWGSIPPNRNYIRAFKYQWKKGAKVKVTDMEIPDALKAKNVTIYDALDLVKEERVIESYPVPEPYAKPALLEKDQANPNWHDEVSYSFNRTTKLIAGVNHILELTKTVKYNGLPTCISKLAGKVSVPHENIIQQAILNSVVWDGTQIKLPKLFDPERPHWNFPRVYGIPLSRKVDNLLNNLLLQCQLAAGKSAFEKRSKILNLFCQTLLKKDGVSLVWTVENDALIAADKPLNPFSENPEETTQNMLPSIYPIKFTLDLEKSNIYKMDEIFPLPKHFRKKFLHTIGVTHNTDDKWLPHEKLSQAIGSCFAFAASQAKQIHGPDVQDLPKPVAIQCVMIDENKVGLLAYQLNTLNISGANGIKNQVWVDGPHPLFELCNRDSGIVGYNHDLFAKVFSFYLNGLV